MPIDRALLDEYDPSEGMLVRKVIALLTENPSSMYYPEEVAFALGLDADGMQTLLTALASSGRVEVTTVLDPGTGKYRAAYGILEGK